MGLRRLLKEASNEMLTKLVEEETKLLNMSIQHEMWAGVERHAGYLLMLKSEQRRRV